MFSETMPVCLLLALGIADAYVTQIHTRLQSLLYSVLQWY